MGDVTILKLPRRRWLGLSLCLAITLGGLGLYELYKEEPHPGPPHCAAMLYGTISGLEGDDRAIILVINENGGRGIKYTGLGNGEWFTFVSEEANYTVKVAAGSYTEEWEWEPLNYACSPPFYKIEVVEGHDITGLNFTLSKK